MHALPSFNAHLKASCPVPVYSCVLYSESVSFYQWTVTIHPNICLHNPSLTD